MPHSITAIILKGKYDNELASKFELEGIELGFDLSMFFINGHYTAYWQKKLNVTGVLETNCPTITWYPSEKVVYELMKKIAGERNINYAVVMTDYFGGTGQQFANLFENDRNVDLGINTISSALKALGVQKKNHHDEFDAVGLSNYRSNPNYLDKYADMADELGV